MNPLEKSTLLMAAIVFARASSLELGLQVKGNPTPCVAREVHDGYCLSFLPKGRPFQCFLDRELVYSCTSKGKCADHGVLSKHTSPSWAANGCKGIPFMKIHEKFLGQYVCVIEDGEKLWEASFKLQFCEIPSLEMRLEFGEKTETCITPLEHVKYCLSLRLNGQPTEGKDFQCYLEGQKIYNCSKKGECKDYGVLTKNTRPKYAAGNCTGIPFANIPRNLTGSYNCVMLDDAYLIEARYYLHYCNDSYENTTHRTNVTEENLNEGSDININGINRIQLDELQLRLLKNNTEVDCVDTKSINVTEYCLSIGEERDHISQFECFLDGVPVYECLSSKKCSERGVLLEMKKDSSQYPIKREVSDTCLGIPFTHMDEKMFGNYTCKVRIGSTTSIGGNYIVKICQNSSDNTTYRTNVTKANLDKDSGINGEEITMYVGIVVLVSLIIVLIAERCRRKCFMKPSKSDCAMTYTKEKTVRSVSFTKIDLSDQECEDLCKSIPYD